MLLKHILNQLVGLTEKVNLSKRCHLKNYVHDAPRSHFVVISLALDMATYYTPKAHNSSGEVSAFQGIAAWSTVLWFLTIPS